MMMMVAMMIVVTKMSDEDYIGDGAESIDEDRDEKASESSEN